MSNQMKNPQKVIYGMNSITEVGNACKCYGKKALVVTGKSSAKKNGYLDLLLKSLDKAGISHVWFNDVDPDPVVENVEAGTKIAIENQVEMVIALGGGSAIDTGKAIAVMATHSGSIVEYETKPIQGQCLPIIAIPTTAGTGSEATSGAVITDLKRMVKMGISAESMIPKLAVLDSQLTMKLPKEITAATGMDALTHAIETYIAECATPFSKPLSLMAIELITQNLKKVLENGEDEVAREKMLYGQFLAGWAITNSATALVHAMSRPLGVYFHIPHGMANAILLVRVMRFNLEKAADKFVEMAPAFQVNPEGKSKERVAEECLQKIEEIYDATGLPKRLRDNGVDKELLPRLAHDAAVNNSNKINPRVATEQEILDMYLELY